jgi:hypothetical protein
MRSVIRNEASRSPCPPPPHLFRGSQAPCRGVTLLQAGEPHSGAPTHAAASRGFGPYPFTARPRTVTYTVMLHAATMSPVWG